MADDKRPDQGFDSQGKEKGKGKGVATDSPYHERPEGQNGNNSIVSRIGKSAAGLSRSLLQSRPEAHDLASVAASGKAESSASRQSAAGESSSVQTQSTSGSAGGFRSAQTASHIASEESAFSNFLDSTPVFVPTEPVGLESGWEDTAQRRALGPGSTLTPASSSIEEQQRLDGQDVVDLLLQPEAPPDPNEDVSISEADMTSLRAALFSDDNSSTGLSSTDWNNALNFIPDFLLWPAGESQKSQAIHDSSMHLGLADSAEAGQAWLEQWNRVLTAYNDEVWGDLGELVQEAREEVKQLEESTPEKPPPETKALRRLRQVLTHIRPKL